LVQSHHSGNVDIWEERISGYHNGVYEKYYFLGYNTLFVTCFHAGFLHGLIFDPEDGGDMFLRKLRMTFNGLHGVISQKIVLFMGVMILK
jgi:hypothetical protein